MDNQRGLKNVVSSPTRHKLFAFLLAALECSGTFTITTNMIVIRILFTEHRHKDECKQALQCAS